eukprot:gene5238-6519_t
MSFIIPYFSISALEFNSTGNYLAIGYTNGTIAIIKLLKHSSSSSSNNNNNGSIINNNHQVNNNGSYIDIGEERQGVKIHNSVVVDNDEDEEDDDDEQFKMDLDEEEEDDNIFMKRKNNSNSNNFVNNHNSNNHSSNNSHDTQVISIRWCKGNSPTLLFLSTNVSCTKLWRIQLLSSNPILLSSTMPTQTSSTIPTQVPRIKFNLKRTFEHEEIFNINSISVNSDGKTFLSSDELRVYLWDLNINQECFNIIDLKPSNIQLLNEIIRVTEFHPTQCNYLVFGTSRGSLKLCDMRTSALISNYSKDLKFSNDGRYIVSRNLEYLSVWDINMETQPLATYSLYNKDYLMAKLYDMHESSSFVDKFQCSFINQSQVITGSYDNKCLIWNPFTSESFIFESNFQQQQPPPSQPSNNIVNQYNGNNGSIQTIPSDFDCTFQTNSTNNSNSNNLFNPSNINSNSNLSSTPPPTQQYLFQQQQQQQINEQLLYIYNSQLYFNSFQNIQINSLSNLLYNRFSSSSILQPPQQLQQQQQPHNNSIKLSVTSHDRISCISTSSNQNNNSNNIINNDAIAISSNHHLFIYH